MSKPEVGGGARSGNSRRMESNERSNSFFPSLSRKNLADFLVLRGLARSEEVKITWVNRYFNYDCSILMQSYFLNSISNIGERVF